MNQIPLEPISLGDSSDAYCFKLLMERGRGFCEIKIADEDGNPLAPRIRIESVGGSLLLYVWDVTAQDAGTHPPGYTQHRVLLSAGGSDPPRRSDSMVMAHAPTTSQ